MPLPHRYLLTKKLMRQTGCTAMEACQQTGVDLVDFLQFTNHKVSVSSKRRRLEELKTRDFQFIGDIPEKQFQQGQEVYVAFDGKVYKKTVYDVCGGEVKFTTDIPNCDMWVHKKHIYATYDEAKANS